MSIEQVSLKVRSLENSYRFYTETLGFKPIMRNMNSAFLCAGSLWCHLERHGDVNDLGFPQTHLALTVRADLFKAIVAKAVKAKIEMLQDNCDDGATMYLIDPDGHKVTVHSRNWRMQLPIMHTVPFESGFEYHATSAANN